MGTKISPQDHTHALKVLGLGNNFFVKVFFLPSFKILTSGLTVYEIYDILKQKDVFFRHSRIYFVLLVCFFISYFFLEIPQECVVWQLPVIFYLDERLLHYTINHIAQAKTDTLGYNHTLLKAPPFLLTCKIDFRCEL